MFNYVATYVQMRIAKLRLLMNIRRYERKINKLWEISYNLPEKARIELGTVILYHESNLEKMKRLCAGA